MIQKRNSDQLLNLFSDDTRESIAKVINYLQKLFQDLQRTIFSLTSN